MSLLATLRRSLESGPGMAFAPVALSAAMVSAVAIALYKARAGHWATLPQLGDVSAISLYGVTVALDVFAATMALRFVQALRETYEGRQLLRYAVAAAYIVAGVAYVLIRAIAFAGAEDTQFSDSPCYLTKAAESLLDLEYYIGSGRFFVVPLSYKVVSALGGDSISAFTTFQFALSVCAWLAFAIVLARRFPGRLLGLAAFGAVLVVSLSSDVSMWDRMIMSESISTSLFVLVLASGLRFVDGVTTARMMCLVTAAGLWSFAREANSVFLLPLAIMLPCWSWRYLSHAPAEQRRCAIAAVLLLTIVGATTLVSRRGDRWVFPLLNVVGIRILPSPERVAFYVERGMPLNERLLAMSGEFGGGQDWVFYHSPDLEAFRRWLMLRGREAYVEDLLSHPLRTGR